jgi:hypothetical protein
MGALLTLGGFVFVAASSDTIGLGIMLLWVGVIVLLPSRGFVRVLGGVLLGTVLAIFAAAIGAVGNTYRPAQSRTSPANSSSYTTTVPVAPGPDDVGKDARAVATKPLTAERSPEPSSPWEYFEGRDDLTGKPTYQAFVSSTNTIRLDFPYAGEQHATLMLRRHPRHGSDVIFKIEKGQFLCHIDECSVLVRFDDRSPERFSATGPSDQSTETLFIQNYGRFVGQLQKAKEVRIAAEIYQAGQPAFEFNVAGLEIKRLTPAPSQKR